MKFVIFINKKNSISVIEFGWCRHNLTSSGDCHFLDNAIIKPRQETDCNKA